ncbi:MAG: glycosyltransferase family 2 protein [Bacteroidales bacterium]|nr:glycosyltransferase family 2 protein [Bacteroidales bacterium]
MTQAPMFSVLIATYNRSALLTRALESLLRQTEKEWEGIIVDDGSTDDTHEKILPLLQAYPQLKYLLKPHRGVVAAKNHAIKSSSGKYITFLDSDDEYHPSHLRSRKEFLIQNPDIRFLYGGLKILGDQYVPDVYNPSTKIHLNDCVVGGTFFIERETLLSLDGFSDMLLGSDHDLFQRARKKKIKMARIDEATYIYHHENTDSITNRIKCS